MAEAMNRREPPRVEWRMRLGKALTEMLSRGTTRYRWALIGIITGSAQYMRDIINNSAAGGAAGAR